MKKSFLGIVVSLFTALFVWGCAANMPVETMPAFTPHEFNANQYASAADNFLVILDASGSMNENYKGVQKFAIAKTVVKRMNLTLPELDQIGGLRFFGHCGKTSDAGPLLYGMNTYSTDQFAKKLNTLNAAWGASPLATALNAAEDDFSSLTGTKALIIITDAKGTASEYQKSLDAVKTLKTKFGSSLCVYPVLVGNNAKGAAFMKKMAEKGGCGFFANAGDLLTSAGMAKYVDDVFLSMKSRPAPKKVYKDSDNDGVYDYMDKCPDTPENVSVDDNGCPFDSDHDGVYDYKDNCPDTPAGAPVNIRGCWTLSNILFDTDKYEIKPDSLNELNESVTVLEKNPSMKIIIQGYTDNVGSAQYNKILSQKRAEAVKLYLVAHGIDAGRLSTVGFGFSKPVATNKTPQGRALNRRVELHPVR